jgi:hypothetical protein
VNGLNAAKGSRQTSHVPLEDVVAPETRSLGPAAGVVSVKWAALRGGSGCCVGPVKLYWLRFLWRGDRVPRASLAPTPVSPSGPLGTVAVQGNLTV